MTDALLTILSLLNDGVADSRVGLRSSPGAHRDGRRLGSR